VRKGVKACFAVVRAHAAIAHAAKGQIGAGQVQQGIVNTAAAKGNVIENPLFIFSIGGE